MKTLALLKGSPDSLQELATYLEPFASLFQRSTDRRSLERYVTGLLSDLLRKNCDATTQTVANTSLEQLQHLLTDAAWDPLALDEQRVRLLVERSPAHGVLVLDDTRLPKQGNASVCVHHQYTETLDKQGNCQIVVVPNMLLMLLPRSSPCIGPSWHVFISQRCSGPQKLERLHFNKRYGKLSDKRGFTWESTSTTTQS